MEEVRSYWQVASINHFCTLFQKPFKLPTFEPEELEQAFIIDVPVCEKQDPSQNNIQLISNGTKTSISNHDSGSDKDDEDNRSTDGSVDDSVRAKTNQVDNYSSSSGYLSSVDTNNRFQPPRNTSSYSSTLNYQALENNIQIQLQQQQQQQQQKVEEEQQSDLHLLVKLAIALLKPHFSSRITPDNWENYLKRIVEANWVDLEHYPSPFRVPFVSSEGLELTKNLNFNDLSLGDKIDLFSALCDYRFWCEDASEAIKDYPLEELRLESVGKDQHGYEYWYFSGTRLFKEEKELAQDLVSRKKRIRELEYSLVELEKSRILREQEEKKRTELEQAKKLAQEAREARLAAVKKQQEEAAAAAALNDSAESATKRRKRNNTPILPPRTGLRERRSSAASNNHESTKQQQPETPVRTTRGSLAKQNASEQKQQPQQSQRQSAQKATRSSARSSNRDDNNDERQNGKKNSSPELPKKPPEVECKEELESLIIKSDERKASWSIACESLEEWEAFVTKFEKTKSTNEKYLCAYLNEYILPHIRAIYAKRAAEARRKEKEMLLSLATRRVSTRIISKKAQEEEEERRAQLREIEIQKLKAEAEVKLRAELEREMRAKKHRFVINGEASSNCSEDGEIENSSRYNLRQQHDLLNDPACEFDGIIHPDKLSDFYEALELIIDTVRTSKHAWPFVDPVPETEPGYYDLIKEPMDLKKLRTKVEFRAYKSFIEVERDFQLLVNNCERFNGPKAIYTKMVYKLWKSFKKNVQLYLQRDLHMNEYETFVYPPQPPAPPPPPPPPQVAPHELTKVEHKVEQLDQGDVQQTNSQLQPPNDSRILPETQLIQASNPGQVITKLEQPIVEEQIQISEPQQLSDLAKYDRPNVDSSPTMKNSRIQFGLPTEMRTMDASIGPETIVEEIIYDTPDNEIYVWQEPVNQDGQAN